MSFAVGRLRHALTASHIVKQSIIVRMRADPVPDDLFSRNDSDRAVALPYPHGIDWLGGMDRLKAKTGVIGIVLKQAVGASRLIANFRWHFIEQGAKTLRRMGNHNLFGSSGRV